VCSGFARTSRTLKICQRRAPKALCKASQADNGTSRARLSDWSFRLQASPATRPSTGDPPSPSAAVTTRSCAVSEGWENCPLRSLGGRGG
jgi:hypothetical protein